MKRIPHFVVFAVTLAVVGCDNPAPQQSAPVTPSAAAVRPCPDGPDVDALGAEALRTGAPASCDDGENTWTISPPS
ncbi:MAG: hypothetical protein WBN04_03445 [Paracoccaceae bacterium]